MWNVELYVATLVLGLLVQAISPVACEAATGLSGTFTTPTQQGTVKFTPLRAFRGGVEGKFVVAGKSYPGSVYAAVGGGTGMVWYYGYSGIMAGNALGTLQSDGTYLGPIWFFDRKGNTTDTGTVTFK